MSTKYNEKLTQRLHVRLTEQQIKDIRSNTHSVVDWIREAIDMRLKLEGTGNLKKTVPSYFQPTTSYQTVYYKAKKE